MDDTPTTGPPWGPHTSRRGSFLPSQAPLPTAPAPSRLGFPTAAHSHFVSLHETQERPQRPRRGDGVTLLLTGDWAVEENEQDTGGQEGTAGKEPWEAVSSEWGGASGPCGGETLARCPAPTPWVTTPSPRLPQSWPMRAGCRRGSTLCSESAPQGECPRVWTLRPASS